LIIIHTGMPTAAMNTIPQKKISSRILLAMFVSISRKAIARYYVGHGAAAGLLMDSTLRASRKRRIGNGY